MNYLTENVGKLTKILENSTRKKNLEIQGLSGFFLKEN